MKNLFSLVITNPITLLLSFSIIIVGNASFGGFFLMFVIGASTQGFLYGIVGIAGIALALFATFLHNKVFPILSIFLMAISLITYFAGAPYENLTVTFFDIIPLITMLFFCSTAIAILIKKSKERKINPLGT